MALIAAELLNSNKHFAKTEYVSAGYGGASNAPSDDIRYRNHLVDMKKLAKRLRQQERRKMK